MTEQPGKPGPARGANKGRTPDQPCLNCGDPTYGQYCPTCGQAKRTVSVSVVGLVMEVLEDQLILSRALPRTLGFLIGRPGRLTTEYIQGRIVRYIAPFRLYLVSSVVFFLALSFWTNRLLDQITVGGEATPEVTAESAEDAAAASAAIAQIDTVGLPPEARVALAQAKSALSAEEAALAAAADGEPTPAVGQGAPAPGQLQAWARNLRVQTGSAARDSLIRARIIERYGYMPGIRAIREFLPDYISYVPHMMFVLLPIFALLLKLLYIRRNRYYAEHFIFALHTHAFVFIMFLLMLLARNWIVTSVLSLWIFVYIWLAMKHVYAQGWFRTTVKYWVLGSIYFLLLNLALAFAVLPMILLS